MIQDVQKLNELRSQLSDKYLTTPFFNTLNDDGIKILTAPTGFGKTWAIWNKISIGYLKDHGDIHIHVAPHVETIDKKEIEDYLSPITDINTFVIHNGEELNFTDIRYALLDGYKIVLILSDRRLMEMMGKGSPLLQLVQDYKGSVLLTRDELSYGTTSKKINYKNDKGYYNKEYKGTYIKNLYKLYKLGANTYGFTATPTREHLREIHSDITEHFKIVNSWPSKEEMLPFQKWYNILNVSEYTTEAYGDTRIQSRELNYISNYIQEKEEHLNRILDEVGIQETNTKFTGILSVQTDIENSVDPRITIDSILTTLRINPNLVNKDYTIIIPTFMGWKEYDYNGNFTGKEGDGNEWLNEMNDPNSPARIMVVIYKGNYGVNIPSLSVGVALRNPIAKTKDTRETVRMSGLQILGRLNRTNMTDEGWNTYNSIYQKFGKMKALEYMMVKNTFDFRGPNARNQYWNDTINDFKYKYGNSYQTVFNNITVP